MKIIKKYDYTLSEESLEKDIDVFSRDAKEGDYHFDHKYRQEGLKLIKAYFRMIEDEFKKQNYAVARVCYKKLMFLLLQSEHNYFDYEDIVGKLNFEKFIANYFTCLIKLCDIEEVFREYLEYLKTKEDYDFESAHRTLLSGLTEEKLKSFLSLAEQEAKTIKEEDYGLFDVIDFMLDFAKLRKDKETFYKLCEKYEHLIGPEQKDEYDNSV